MIIKPIQPLNGYQLISELRTAGIADLLPNSVTVNHQGIRILVEDTVPNDAIVTNALAVHVPNPSFDLTDHLAEERALAYTGV